MINFESPRPVLIEARTLELRIGHQVLAREHLARIQLRGMLDPQVVAMPVVGPRLLMRRDARVVGHAVELRGELSTVGLKHNIKFGLPRWPLPRGEPAVPL